MNRVLKIIESIKEDEKTGKRIMLLTISFALLLCISVIKPVDSNAKYISTKDGNIVQIRRDDLSNPSEFKFKLTIKDKDKTQEESIVIRPKTKQSKRKTNRAEDLLETREEEIREAIISIEQNEKKTIKMPTSLPSGAKLIWHKENEKFSGVLFIPLFYLGLVGWILKNNIDENRDNTKEDRKAILNSLPRFSNQLLLLMNAGMILPDAFKRICGGYSQIRDSEKTQFQRELVQLNSIKGARGLSTANLINEYAAKYNSKELMRIATILNENEKRGSDVIGSLGRESRYLWDERKVTASEKGKMIDTKMAYPMGLLLIVLIVITMAPAMLTM